MIRFSSVISIPVLIVILLAAGVIFLMIGLRGRRVNDHPICTACGFDLDGLVSPARCPECGADLAAAAAVRVGVRVRRPRLAIAGGVMLLAGVLGLSAGVAAFLGGPNVHKVTPTGVLLLEARVRTDAGLEDVLKELLDRDMNGALSLGQRESLARCAFVLQQNPRLAFPKSAAAVLNDDTLRGLLSPGEQTTAMAQGAYVALASRPHIRAGKPLPMRLGASIDDRFVGAGARGVGCTSVLVRVLDEAGNEIARREHPAGGTLQTFPVLQGGGKGSATSYLLSIPLDVPPGTYTLEATTTVYLTRQGRMYPYKPAGDDVPISATHRVALEVLPPSERPVRLVVDESARAALQKSLFASLRSNPASATQSWIGMGIGISPEAASVKAILDAVKHTVAGVYRAEAVRVNDDGTTDPRSIIRLGPCIVRYKDAGWHFQPPGTMVDNPLPTGLYRITLTPDTDYAENLVDDDVLIDGVLVFERVELR